ncbi:MAG: YafY family transcriptional regulator [Spirochaetes bacterium]|nr:YafY family transcriptional regulator [Spirochaetota bacterium]
MGRMKPLMHRVHFIDRKIRDGSYPNARSLAKEYEVSERTILRDIEYMRDMLDCPIEYDTGKRGYYYTESSFSIPAVHIGESELFALCVAERALEQYRATPLYETLARVFDKLVLALPGEVKVNYSWLNPEISFLHRGRTEIDPAVWEAIAAALTSRTVLRITHRKAGAEEATERFVEPRHMLNYDGEWYLIARCRTRNEEVTFAISRIENALPTGEPCRGPGDFDVTSYLGEHFGIVREGESHRVEVAFSPEAAPYVRERTWHGDQELRDLAGGGVVISFTTNSLVEVRRWVLGWGAAARALAPERLVEEIREELESALGKYR